MITEEDAIRKGRQMVIIPRLLCIAGLFIYLMPLTLYVMVQWGKVFFPPGVLQWFILYTVVGFFFFIYLPLVFLRRRTDQWRLWAFSSVSNVHLLMKMANDAALIAPQGSLLWRLMDNSKNANEQWTTIKEKFNNADSLNDGSVPSQTSIYYSKTKLFLALLLRLPLTLVMAGLLYIMVNKTDDLIFMIILAVLSIVFLVSAGTIVIKMFDRGPQLVISDQGILTRSAGSQSWADIIGEKVTLKPASKRNTRHYYLNYNLKGESVRVDVTLFDINWIRLERILSVYRERSKTNFNYHA